MAHSHSHGTENTDRSRLLACLLLAASYFGVEVVGGLYTGSLALLADAGHMLGDVAAMTLALLAAWWSQRTPPPHQTFGYRRAEVLAAAINAVGLLVVGVMILREAVARWSAPPEVLAKPLIVIAAGGLVVNILALWILSGGRKGSMNVRAAFLHVAADALGSIGATLSGIAMWAFDARWVDPAASLLIASLVIFSALSMLRQSGRVLMQAAPRGLDVADLTAALAAHAGVVEVHDVHAWTLTDGQAVMSAHVVMRQMEKWSTTHQALAAVLRDRFHIAHATLQPEESADAAHCHCAFAPAAGRLLAVEPA